MAEKQSNVRRFFKRTLVLFVLLIMCVTLYLDSKGIELVDMLKARFITTTVQKSRKSG